MATWWATWWHIPWVQNTVVVGVAFLFGVSITAIILLGYAMVSALRISDSDY